MSKAIHAARAQPRGQGTIYLLLKEAAPYHYVWFIEKEEEEIETAISAPTIDDALKFARQFWKQDSFRTLICGFRYTLPERDEHGCNAFFHQMISSYSNSGKVYFDDDLGSNCFVANASTEALAFWRYLQNLGRLI